MPLRKKLDPRIKTLIENGRTSNHRSFLVIVGDKGKDQVRMMLYVLTTIRSLICITCLPSPQWEPNLLFCGVIRKTWDLPRVYAAFTSTDIQSSSKENQTN